ncbi:MAG: tRNA-specific adenosine deaminase [Deltaproteobacteria bacterium]|nr:MAG: tRNA-specific adenosine deaminase [Deltaproteobacteria bacterium]RLB00926.1 MAG: tRNA-specific adenosine deaminase [Deltaproteobacteria bacterium]
MGSLRADEAFMEIALEEAEAAAREGEVPVGAVLVRGEEVLARDHNRTIALCDPTAHAEILVLRQAARVVGNRRLLGCDLYVTVEPCVMCAGAIVQARIRRLIFGARDEKGGALSLYGILCDEKLNHTVEVVEGVKASRARALMQSFFRGLRSGEVPKWS